MRFGSGRNNVDAVLALSKCYTSSAFWPDFVAFYSSNLEVKSQLLY